MVYFRKIYESVGVWTQDSKQNILTMITFIKKKKKKKINYFSHIVVYITTKYAWFWCKCFSSYRLPSIRKGMFLWRFAAWVLHDWVLNSWTTERLEMYQSKAKFRLLVRKSMHLWFDSFLGTQGCPQIVKKECYLRFLIKH